MGLQERNGTGGCVREFVWQGGDAQIPAIFVEHVLHEKISSDEFVPVHSFARLAHDRCDGHVLMHFGHVTRLATTLGWIIAMEPFEVWHLLWKIADLFSARPQSLSVQSVASTAQCRVANVSGLSGHEAACRGLHHALVSGVDDERTIL